MSSKLRYFVVYNDRGYAGAKAIGLLDDLTKLKPKGHEKIVQAYESARKMWGSDRIRLWVFRERHGHKGRYRELIKCFGCGSQKLKFVMPKPPKVAKAGGIAPGLGDYQIAQPQPNFAQLVAEMEGLNAGQNPAGGFANAPRRGKKANLIPGGN